MILGIALVASLLQTSPAAQQPAAKATVAGVVVNSATGDPIPNTRVVLARTDVRVGPFIEFMTSADGRLPMEITLSAEMLAAMGNPATREGANPGAAALGAAFSEFPVSEVHEIVFGISGSVGVVSKASPPAWTDDRGRFVFANVEPGTYRLIFDSEGFSKRDYGQRTENGEGVPMVLTAGQAKTDIVMRLMPVASIEGRLRDATGQPAAGVPVQLFRFEYDETGKKTVKSLAATHSDDRGEYRMYFLPPGRYYLSAGNRAGSTRPEDEAGFAPGLVGAGYFTPNRMPQKYGLSYYPGVADVSLAIPIELQPGADLRNIDLPVDTQKSYRVRGRVVDQSTGRPPQDATFSLMADIDEAALILAGFGIGANGLYEASDGTFEIRNVSSGRYSLTATLPGQPVAKLPDISTLTPEERTALFRADMAEQQRRPSASMVLNVANADVEGLMLTVGTGYPIAGRFRIEGNTATLPLPMGVLRVLLSSPTMARFNDFGNMLEPTAGDGSFRLTSVHTGEYRLAVFGVPAGFYVKHARLGGTDVLNGPLRVSGPQSDTLDILISSNMGAISGVALNAAGQPAPGARVVLIPNNRERTELFRPVSSDSTGRFNIPLVAPGEYILAAWDAIEPYAFFDPELIRQAERQGKAIRVAELSNQTTTVTSIPAPGQ
jgi:5-hydroxyisourate hydrolase-like protein (transthyretin family)